MDPVQKPWSYSRPIQTFGGSFDAFEGRSVYEGIPYLEDAGRYGNPHQLEFLLQLCIFGSSLFQNGYAGISVFPQAQKILVRGLCLRFVS